MLRGLVWRLGWCGLQEGWYDKTDDTIRGNGNAGAGANGKAMTENTNGLIDPSVGPEAWGRSGGTG